MENKILFTSEAVSEGHPDKICDQISDAILDACLDNDKESHVACECYVTENFLLIGGEITTNSKVNYEEVARNVIKEIGYDNDELGFNYKTVKILNLIQKQSPDINMGVVKEKVEDQGAGDQGIMFGYATNESKNYMPLSVSISQELVKYATKLRKENKFKYARPDMKASVTYDYTNNRIETILMSVQHTKDCDFDSFKKFIKEEIMIPVAKSFNQNIDFNVLINPTGRFEIGGPKGDTGLTGRKIIVDTYGGYAKHGGGAFSGKDPSKVDRSAAYYARYVAKNLVAAGVSDKLELQVGYAIGESKPLSINVNCLNTNKISEDKIITIINKLFDFRPGMLIKELGLKERKGFNYFETSKYGHFGRDELNLPWEKLDKVDIIKEMIKE